jgi:hypothetical protein
MGDKFTPENRAELLAMYTGLAMQSLVSSTPLQPDHVGAEAVKIANATVDALERFYAGRPQ